MTEELLIINEETIKNKMYYIRGEYVMIDSDLAKIYGYTTKAFNQQVQRNIEKFDDDFMFQLTDEEVKIFSRSQNVTLKKTIKRGHNIKYNPYAFTEQGIYMLMTVLKGELAIKQSKALIRIFKGMKDYLINNNVLNQENINNMVLKHDNEINYINNEVKQLQETFNKMEEKELKNKIFFNGQLFDSYLEIIKILSIANKLIIIIDSYADETILEILSKINKKTILITRKNNLLKKIDVTKYNEQYNNLKIVYDNSFHDRFIILDKDKIYHLGSSINHIGNKTFAINIMEEDIVKESLLKKINNVISILK